MVSETGAAARLTDAECVAFLQDALPRLRLRWPGFRKVRKQVRKRIRRRMDELGLPDIDAYRRYLDEHPAEWSRLEEFCRIPISRFYRDRGVFDWLADRVLPELGRRALGEGRRELVCWSTGCASGEEPYSLAILWMLGRPPALRPLSIRIVATDSDERLLERAENGCYSRSSLKELPRDWLPAAFSETDGRYCLKDEFRAPAEFRRQDIRRETPRGPFDLVLCRNLVFTYFAEPLQREVAARIAGCMRSGGVLVLGKDEELPDDISAFHEFDAHHRMYRRR